jgi:photoactive yellow protein
MKFVAFGSDNIDNLFANLEPTELDEIPFGVIQVDRKGTILLYNQMQGAMARLDPKSVIGKNFFTDIAPCTEATGFRAQFEKGIASGKLNVVFEWLTNKASMPIVQVHLKQAICGTKFWIFVKVL